MYWELEFFSSAWHAVSAFLIFLLGIVVAKALCKSFGASARRALLLYAWHTLFCVIYAVYTQTNVADSTLYFLTAVAGNTTFKFGMAAVESITFFCVSVLGLSYFGTFLFFNILGFIGLLAFDASLRVATADKSKAIRRLATLIVLLPSVSFWSSALGKDAIAFMATGLGLWAALHLKQRVWLMALAVFLMLIVRPHMAGVMIMALAGSQIIQPKIPFAQRVIMGGAAIAAAAVMIPVALDYTGVGSDASAEQVISYLEERQQLNQEGGSSIDIASMSLPMQLFTYLFRPLPNEAHSLLALASSMDNVILLLLFIVAISKSFKPRRQAATGNHAFLWMFSILSWVLLASTTANLGIAVRQKWMFVPMLLFLIFSQLGKRKATIQKATVRPASHWKLHNARPETAYRHYRPGNARHHT